MSMPAPDLRRSFHGIRRYGIVVGIAVAVSLLAGIATAAVSPVTVTSTALVALPQAGQDAVAASGGEPAPFTATQEVIAGSNPVLAGALPDVRPGHVTVRASPRCSDRQPGSLCHLGKRTR
jgi:hypothetical protein